MIRMYIALIALASSIAVTSSYSEATIDTVFIRQLVLMDGSGNTTKLVIADATRQGRYYLEATLDTVFCSSETVAVVSDLLDSLDALTSQRSSRRVPKKITVSDMLDSLDQMPSRTNDRQVQGRSTEIEHPPSNACERDMLVVELVRKSFGEADYQSYITMQLQIANRCDTGVRAFRGVVHFKDVFGDVIKSVRLTHDDLIKPHGSTLWSGNIKYNQFIDSDVKLRNTEQHNLLFEFELTQVIYSDGTRVSY